MAGVDDLLAKAEAQISRLDDLIKQKQKELADAQKERQKVAASVADYSAFLDWKKAKKP